MSGPHGGDRNARARTEFNQGQQAAAMRRQREAFQGDFQLGRAVAVDRFGNRISEGDNVLFRMPNADPVYVVKSITPSLDPSHPVGVLKVELTCEIPLMVGANQAVQSMIRVGTARDMAGVDEKLQRMEKAAGPHNEQENVNAGQYTTDPPGAGDLGDAGDPGDPADPGDDPDGGNEDGGSSR